MVSPELFPWNVVCYISVFPMPQEFFRDLRLPFRSSAGKACALGVALIGCWSSAQAAVPPENRGSWETFGNGPGHTGYYPAAIGPNDFIFDWGRDFTAQINPPVVYGTSLFYTTNGYFNEGMHAGALDARTGDIRWTYPLARAFSVNPPTYAEGKLYFQRGNHSSDTHLWCLDAATGDLIWAAPHSAQWERYLAPTVSGGSVWVAGGYYGGVYGFDALSGQQRFFTALAQIDHWTPSFDGDLIYAWQTEFFRALNPATGAIAWSVSLGTNASRLWDSLAAVSDGRAFLASTFALHAIDLSTHQKAWEVGGTFTGTPAVDHEAVYAISGSTVASFDAATGRARRVYVAGGALTGQPIVTKDCVLAASASATYVFDRATGALRQTLPSGGSLIYAAGRLYVASAFGSGLAGRIDSYRVTLEEPDPSPTPLPVPPPSPTPQPTPTPHPEETPTPSPDPTPTPTPAPIPDATATPPPGYAGPLWLAAQTADDIAYFLFGSPDRIERFDLERQMWLDPIILATAPKAFAVDGEGIYVGGDAGIWRYPLNGALGSRLAATASPVVALQAHGTFLVVQDSTGKFSTVNKATGRPIAIKDYTFSMGFFSLAPGRGQIYGRTFYDIYRIEVGADGSLGAQIDSSAHAAYPNADRVFISPDERRVIDNAGIVYDAGDLSYVTSLAGEVTDLSFSGESPVVVRGQTLVGYSDSFLQSGSVSLHGTPRKVQVRGDYAYVFHSADTRGVWVQRVALNLLVPPEPAPAVNPNGLGYWPDAVEFGDGVIYLLSRANLSVFRWSLGEKKYLPTIALTEAPTHVAYAAASKRLYLGYASGRLTHFADGVPGPERAFVNLPSAVLGLTAVGNAVFACDASGAWVTHYTFDANGGTLSQKDWNYYSDEYVWNGTNRKVYFLRDDSSPNDVLWEDIDEEGRLGEEMDSPYHTSSGISHPVRVKPDGTEVLLGTGKIFDGTTLEAKGFLANPVIDALWGDDGRLYSIRASAGQTEIQRWEGADYGTFASVRCAGEPRRIFDSGNDLCVLAVVNGHPRFYSLDYQLSRPPLPDPTPSPPTATPNPSPTATPEPSPTATPAPSPSPTASPRPPVPPTPRPTPDRTDRIAPIVRVRGENVRRSPLPFVILSGTARDNRSLRKVEIQSNGGSYRRANGGRPEIWYGLFDLKPGRNVFLVRAIDAAGNVSKLERVSVFYDRF